MTAKHTTEPTLPKPNPAEVMAGSPSIIGILSAVSLICGLLIVSVAQVTAAPIARNLADITRDSVKQLVPGTEQQILYVVTDEGDVEATQSLEGSQKNVLIAAYDAQGTLMGIVLEARGLGYGGPVTALFAYSPDLQAITGYKVLDSRETPGLGDKIVTDAAFQKNFELLDASLNNPIVTVRHGKKTNAWEIDAISGATVSSKTIGRMANQSAHALVPLINKNLDRIKAGK